MKYDFVKWICLDCIHELKLDNSKNLQVGNIYICQRCKIIQLFGIDDFFDCRSIFNPSEECMTRLDVYVDMKINFYGDDYLTYHFSYNYFMPGKKVRIEITKILRKKLPIQTQGYSDSEIDRIYYQAASDVMEYLHKEANIKYKNKKL